MGVGAAGFGALAMLPSASAFNIRTSNPLKYFGDDQDNPNFSVQPDGTLQTQSISVEEASIGNVVGVFKWQDDGNSQTISPSTVTKVEWETSYIEDSTIVSLSSSNNDITVETAGKYIINGFYTYEQGSFSSGDNVVSFVYVNGSQEASRPESRVWANRESFNFPTTILTLSAGDKVDVRTIHTSGNDEDLSSSLGNSANRAMFSVRRIG